eukprot:TRINITY_DN7117_c0_g2_i1.p1 TRINITY_DN7117_c0_g2~~TRINITY_DN7117_c0_g2_i1.p1  ORF type:complete len:364 (+),score=107.91 TRINITY_DN7117_c0_g2_i1:46-1137(+)
MAVVITGATRGHGAVLAQELMLRGVPVLMTGRGEGAAAKCKALVDEVEAEMKHRRTAMLEQTGLPNPDAMAPQFADAAFHELDVGCDASVRKFVTHFHDKLSTSPVKLVNNAAENYPGWTQASVAQAVQNNTIGTIKLTESLLPHMCPGSSVYNVLCRHARPRVGSKLSAALVHDLYAMTRMSTPEFIKAMRAHKPDFADKDMLAIDSHAALIYSKALLYVYTVHAFRAQLQRRASKGVEFEIPVNGICPGHMNTPLALWPTERSPYEAIHTTIQACMLDDHGQHNLWWWARNGEFPKGHLFTSGQCRPLEWLLDPTRPSMEGKTLQERSGVFIAHNDDWRPNHRPEQGGDGGLFGRFKAYFA